MTVLIVDDNTSHRKILKTILEAQGFGVLEAENGAEALRVLKSEKTNCVISDILMPVMDGYRLCYEIRKTPELQHIPIILHTATFDQNSERAALDFGADRFMTKLTDGVQMAGIVRELIGQDRKSLKKSTSAPTEFEVMKEYSQTLIRKLEERNVELETQAEDLRRLNGNLQTFSDNTIAREQRMIELKREVNGLSEQLGRKAPYDLSFVQLPAAPES